MKKIHGSDNQRFELELNNGVKIPRVGLGTWLVQGQQCTDTVRIALKMGYTHIDTAIIYRNHSAIAPVLKEFKREDIFITSKLPPTMQGYDICIDAFNNSCKELGVDYIDCFLIHFPSKSKEKITSPKNAEFRKQSWLALEKLYKEKKARCIGVSNYTVEHLKELLTYCSVMPQMNQVELHPFYDQKDLLCFCEQHRICVASYSPLGCGKFLETRKEEDQSLLETFQEFETVLCELSLKYGKSNAQILLQWNIQLSPYIVVLPKSCSEQHLRENLSVGDFSLSAEEMERISSFGKIQVKFCWSPNGVL